MEDIAQDWIQDTLETDSISFGLEMQRPWSQHLMEGRKTIEVRGYTLPEQLLDEKIFIMETQEGTAGKSALQNSIDLTSQSKDNIPCEIIGWCRFSSIKEYTTQTAFETDAEKHLVTPNSGYAWKEEVTQILYGWVVQEVNKTVVGRNQFTTAIRQKRSLFQLHHNTGSK